MNSRKIRIGNYFKIVNQSNGQPMEPPIKIMKAGLLESEYILYNQYPDELKTYPIIHNRSLSRIPLTIKWFSDFGGKVISDNQAVFHSEGEFFFCYDASRLIWTVLYKNNGIQIDLPTKIESVDQLQDFWLGLTGKELILIIK